MKKQILKTGKHAGEKKVFMPQEMLLVKGGIKIPKRVMDPPMK